MSQRIGQYLALFIGAGLLALVQFSLVSSLPWPWNNLDLPIIAVIFSFLFFSRDQTWLLAAASGWFLDVLGFHPFGLALLSLLFSAIIIYLVLENILTNRSLYSFLLLTFIGLVAEAFLYHIFLAIFDWSGASQAFFLVNGAFWEALAWKLVLSLLIVGLFFNLIALASRRLQPFFLKER